MSQERADPAVSAHLERCADCREHAHTIRANNALLERLHRSRAGLAATREPGLPGAIPGYEIRAELHRGGQGVVYRAEQLATSRTVALKVLLAGAFATTRQRRRFEREIDLVAGLRHPNIVTVHDSGVTAEGRHWFAMELLEGETLNDYVRGAAARLGLRARLALFCKICAAVSHAHQRGVIHRDLKPGNVIVDAAGEPHVLDFGLAKAVDPEVRPGDATVTVAGGFLGTLAYAAPEQVAGDHAAVDVRSDVYALGVILYELLTGAYPYPVTGRISDVIDAITRTPPGPLASHRETPYRLGDEVDTIARKALAKEPQRRYQSVEALRVDVEHFLAGEPIDAKRDSGFYVLRKTLGRYKAQAAAGAAGIVLLAAFGAAMSVLWRRASLEAQKVTQINVFLEDTLGSVEPPGAGEVTVRNFLDEGVHWIDLALADQPEIEASVRALIGNAYRNIGALDQAERELVASLATRREVYGDDHPEIARSLSGLGLLRLAQGRPADAERHFAEALAIRERALGAEHLQVSMALGNLAQAKRRRGSLDEAEALLRRSLAILQPRLGDAHADVAMCRFQLAGIFEDRGDYALARAMHEQALATRRAVLHQDHPDLARSEVAIAALYLRLGRPAEAEPPLRACLERHERVLPVGHWRTARVRQLLGESLAAQGRAGEARAYLQQGYDGLRAALGEDHPETQAALRALEKSTGP